MPITRIFARGIVLMLAAAVAIATFDAAHAASKHGKPAKPPKAAHAARSWTGANPATASPPDPGSYK